MKTKTHTPSPLESSEASQNPKPKEKPPGSTERKEVAQRNWRDGSMIGARFGKLTVIGAGVPHRSTRYVLLVPCRCDCGAQHLIRTGGVRRCPKTCLSCKPAMVSEKMRVHGKEPKDLHRAWLAMRNRCNNPRCNCWDRYGGRGISVCERWDSFENFKDDMGPRPSHLHTLDRIDNEGDYCPENCRWATRKEQSRNRNFTRLITVRGETKPLGEWVDRSPVSYMAVYQRLAKGWDPEKAIFTPNLKQKKA